MKQSFYDLSYSELEGFLINNALHPSAAPLLFRWHYKNKEITTLTTDIARKSLDFFAQHLDFSLPEIDTVRQSQKDQTVKFLFKLKDNLKVETVLIPFNNKYSICLSSQVGCAMSCSFCFTGKQGLTRNLSTHEIVGQFIQAWRWLAKNRPGEERILNIVFMGQGEPLHNFDEVKKAIDFFLNRNAFNLGPRQITVSSAGYLPGLSRFSELSGVNLAISFHSPKNSIRNKLIPINQKYPIEELIAVLKTIPLKKRQYITFEYLLIDELNNTEADAEELSECLNELNPIINLIPFNPFPGSNYRRPSKEKVDLFKDYLVKNHLRTMVRTTKGDEILAACGQLNTKSL
mgnify:CR=1 FL=1